MKKKRLKQKFPLGELKKLFCIMKLVFFFLLLSSNLVWAGTTYAQLTSLNLDLNNVTLEEVFDAIRKQSEFEFFYNNDQVNTSVKVTVKAKNADIYAVLEQALPDIYEYKINDRYILINKRKEITSLLSTQPQPQPQQTKKTISGTVTDKEGEAIIGANIVEKGTTNGTVTDVDGKFSLIVENDAMLHISYIGYLSQDINIIGRSSIDIILKEDTKALDELVVIGFGTQKKVNLTGSVGVVGAEMLEERPVINVVQALQGTVPGLIISNTARGGELNAAKSIRIRGTGTIGNDSSGDPLVLVDGMPGSLYNLNPQDIESISILKDASASSIYGSRAPFGVILVTTKQGKEGKPTINYNNSFRFNTPNMMPELQNSWEFVNYFDDAEFNGTNNHLYDAAYMEMVKNYFEGKTDPAVAMFIGSGGKWNGDYAYGNVDWLEEYYKKWSSSQEHNLSIGGGTDKFTYYLSANYLGQSGFLRYGNDEYDRYTVSGKISAVLTSYLKVDYTSRYSRINFARPTMWNDDFYNHLLRRARPVRPILDPNGYYASDVNYIDPMENGGRHKEQNTETVQQVKLTITPLKDWNIIGEMNFRESNNWAHEDQHLIYSHYADNPEATYKAVYSPANSSATEAASRTTYINSNIYSNYQRSFDRHNLSGTVGFQYERSDSRALNGYRTGLITDDLPILDLTTNTTDYYLSGNYNKWRTAGFFGRVNYDYDGKYLLEANTRYDGTSRFRRDDRWVWSPSGSIGWNIARENFFAEAFNDIQMLKIRMSYGVLANQNTTDLYPTYQTITTTTSGANWLLDGQKPNISAAPTLVSRSLTWEKIYSQNIGLDWSVLNSRLTGSFDYYIRKTEDMVRAGVELPAILGTAVPPTNNTDLKSYGWELEVGWRDQINDFSYGIRINIADAKTKITKFANPTGSLSTYIAGQQINDIYGFTTIGIAKTNEEMQAHLDALPEGGQDALGNRWAAGDIMYADINGDGKINSGAYTIHDMGDLKKIGNSTPRYLTGINLDASWKGLTLQMFWQGVLKRDYMPGDLLFWGANSGGQWWSTGLKPHMDYFRAEDHPFGQNMDAYYPRPLFNSGKNQQPQTKYLQNAAYLRLKSLQIGYTLPASLTRKFLLDKVRVFAAGENLLTITNLTKVMDPETAGVGVRGGTLYPLSKTYSFGINFNF
ncbi:MAG: SusC/RagA family protein [Bacteroidia bacterium 44-10]|nr:MAG: SusC/RagA family protein [Bacteroidia bacterium 44-10]